MTHTVKMHIKIVLRIPDGLLVPASFDVVEIASVNDYGDNELAGIVAYLASPQGQEDGMSKIIEAMFVLNTRPVWIQVAMMLTGDEWKLESCKLSEPPSVKNEFKEGQRVWDRAGREYEYIAPWVVGRDKVALYDVVTDCDEDGEGDFVSGIISVLPVSDLYASAPVAVYDKKVAEFGKRIAAIREELNRLVAEKRKAETQYNDTMKRLASLNGLRHLEAVLAGTITHYVIQGRSWKPPSILAFQEAVDTGAPKQHGFEKLRLLSLYGSATNDLEWRLHDYQDISGDWGTVIPCASRLEAQREVEKIFAAVFAKVEAGDKTSSYRQVWVDAADAAGVTVPKKARVMARDAVLAEIKEQQARVEKEMEQVAKRLASVPALPEED